MNLVLERSKDIKCYTNMRIMFDALGDICEQYDWYVREVETNGYDIPEGWLTGEALKHIIYTNKIQFIWAVFSAFEKGMRPLIAIEPEIRLNEEYWYNPQMKTQIPEAEFEIGCWDSCATVFIGLNETLANRLKVAYPGVTEFHCKWIGSGHPYE